MTPYAVDFRTIYFFICSYEYAIHSTLGARTVEGVKRRTRAGMGRCQSGFCQYKVMQILSRELGIPEEQVLFEEQGAQVLYGKIKG